MSSPRPCALVLCVLVLFVFAAAPARAAYPFADDAEGGSLSNWSADPPWANTATLAHAGSRSFTDSPGTNYANGVNASLSLAQNLDLSHATRPRLSFWHRYTLEQGYDFGRVEISLNGGATWDPAPLATYTGSSEWAREQLDLGTWVGQAAVKVRFRIVADATVTQDGWFIDDVLIDEGPPPVTLAAPSGATANSLTLSWSSSADAAFGSYRVVRGLAPGFDYRRATTVATIANRATTTAIDFGLSPKSSYWYRVIVSRTNGLETPSNEVSGTTLAGMDFPFVDNGEGGPATWVADYPWSLSAESAHDGTKAWSDSPGGNYAPSLSGTSLTLASPINLATAARPVLSFWHTAVFPGNDHGLVEVSTNGGLTWTALLDVTNASITAWTHAQLDLSGYRAASVLLRFRVTTDSGTEGDGWHLDGISVSEQPSTVAAPALSNIGPHSVTLTWLANSDLNFDHYAIHRSAGAGCGLNSPIVAAPAAQSTTAYTDSGLLIGTQYAWRVYAVNRYGAYGADSPTESGTTTTALPLPFTDGFESGLGNWNATGAWSTTALVAHGGTSSLQDGPGNYPDSADTWIATQLDLSGTGWPVLTFWDRLDFQVNADAGHVQVSPDGTTWTSLYAATGTRSTWLERQVDLSQWKGLPRLWVRFRVRTDGAVGQDGWSIDDLRVDDRAPAVASLPFIDGFESGLANWFAGNWESSSLEPQAGTKSLEDFPRTAIPFDGWFTAHLARPFNLAAATSPQFVFWIKGSTGYQQSVRAQVSLDGGATWTDLWVSGGSWPAWTRIQLSLASFRGPATRLRFATTSGCCWDAAGIALDGVAVEEAPLAPAMNMPVPHLKSVDVSWTTPALSNFRRYEVYRAAHAGVDTSATRIATITSQSTTSTTDTGLSIGKTYWYRVFVVTTDEVYSASNEVSSTTTPLALPLSDPMENDANWVTEGTVGAWGIATDTPHGGAAYFSDSPSGTYPENMDASLTTAVDLSAAVWPVLTFWDRMAYQVNADAGRVEVSIDSGASWATVYAAVGSRSGWLQRQVDLSPFTGNASVIVRFHAVSDGAVANDGWCVDDVTIAELAAPARTLPFGDGFEGGTGNWLAASWELETASPHAGTRRLKDFPRTAIPWSGWFTTNLSGTFDLSTSTAPQLTFWLTGSTGYQQSIRAQLSTDGGRNWLDLWVTGGNWSAWTRVQVGLESYRVKNVRFRFATTSGCCWDASGIALDDIAIEEAPLAPVMASPTPHLKTMDVSWSAPSISNFKQYEVYRSTHPGVDLSATRIATITNRTTTSVTDTGLSIGKSYWYRVYVVTTGDVYNPSNEVSATTSALALPVHDSMESDGNWVTEGANGAWSMEATTPLEGSGSFSDSPGGNYNDNLDVSLTTAVNLATAAWPVLTFWDRFEYQVNADLGHVDISIDSGNSWTGVYAATGSSPSWTKRRIDLSPWKTYTSVMIRFRSVSDGGTTANGWSIDDLSIAEDTTPARALPFYDGFEGGAGNWLASNWETEGSDVRQGSAATADFSRSAIPWGGWFASHLAGALDLSTVESPQLTFWIKGSTGYQQSIRAQVSADGGRTWPDVWVTGGSWPVWTRIQLPLGSWRQPGVRLRFVTTSGCCWDASGVRIDDVAVEAAPAKPGLSMPDQVQLRSMRLSWTRNTSADFQKYVVYRSTSPGVTESSPVVATLTNASATTFTDTTLEPRTRYFYRVFVYTARDTSTGSDEVSGTTSGSPIPFTDGFETDTGQWTRGGSWTREAGLGRAGGAALTDGPGVYPNNADTAAQLGFDLTTTSWPVLTFWEKHAFQVDADFGRVEISADFGASWTGVLAVSGTSTDWTERRVDLSPWRTQPNVWIRFRVTTDGGTANDGFTVDDVSIAENGVLPSAYPFFDGFEQGLGRWLQGQWSPSPAGPHRGLTTADNSSGYANPWGGWFSMTLGSALDLSHATSPAWTFYVRGATGYQQSIRAQVSTDGGVNWVDLWVTGGNWNAWTRISLPLDAYRVPGLRFRFVYTGGCCSDQEGVLIDDVGIGEPAPGAPAVNTPAEGATVGVLRPTLVVTNADDPQADPLTYSFEVFADPSLTTRVAQVPAVSEGTTTTTWTVDTDLADDHQYWWRSRASDGTNTGPWMAAGTFFVVVKNDPPSIPEFVSPPNGATLWGTDAPLTWYRSTDPNPGDGVTYDLAIDDDPAFASPAIDEHGITDSSVRNNAPAATPTVTVTLGEFAGYANLQDGTLYYWRLRAVDSRGLASAWTGEVRYFHFGKDAAPPVVTWSTPSENATATSSPVILSGTALDTGSGLDYVQVSTDGGATWNLASGAGSWSYDLDVAQNGSVTALARAADRAGNVSAAAARHFTIALPDVPRSPRAVPDNSVITIAWDPPQLAGVTGYNVYRSGSAGGPFTRVNGAPLTGPPFRDTGLENGTSYFYVATALYASRPESAHTPTVTARPMASGLPPFVDDLAVRRSGNDLRLSWSAVTTDPGSGPTVCSGYWTYEGPSPALTPANSAFRHYATSATDLFPGGFGDGKRHFFLVTATGSDGREGFFAECFLEDSDPSVGHPGSWAHVADGAASGGSYLASSTAGARLSIAFNGTGISLGLLRGPAEGLAQVVLDGVPAGTIDLYADTPEWLAWPFHRRGLVDAAHTLELVVSGTKNGLSTGTEVALDRVLVGREPTP